MVDYQRHPPSTEHLRGEGSKIVENWFKLLSLLFSVHSIIRIFSFLWRAEESPGPASYYNINNIKRDKQIAKGKKPGFSFGKRIKENLGMFKNKYPLTLMSY